VSPTPEVGIKESGREGNGNKEISKLPDLATRGNYRRIDESVYKRTKRIWLKKSRKLFIF
jgi:hypothetical protein